MSIVINNKREQSENCIRVCTDIRNVGGFAEYLDITYPDPE
jgi:hypothetical protein